MRTLSLLLLTVLTATAVRGQPVTGEVRALGFATPGALGRVVVDGTWFPILVDLNIQTSEPLQVSLHLERFDLDGDRVDFVDPQVTLTPGAGVRRVWCYAVTNELCERRSLEPRIDVYAADGSLLTQLPLPLFERMDGDQRLVLDISGRSPRGLPIFADQPTVGASQTGRRHYRGMVLATLSEVDLPDRWIGLEGVDTIVWDDPDPARLDPAQLDALITWVRRGGKLILGLGPAATRVDAGALAAISPFEAGARIVTLPDLARFRQDFRGGSPPENPINVAIAPLRSDADSIFSDRGSDGRRFELLAQRVVGSGRVTASAAALADLTTLSSPGELWPLLIGIDSHSQKYIEATIASMTFQFGDVSHSQLVRPLVGPTEYRGQAGALVLMALLFVGTYILVATVATWLWLKSRRGTSWSWPVFALVATVGSVVSLGAVEMMGGLRESTQSFQFVDLASGERRGLARGYIGYRSRSRDGVEVKLADGEGFVRPLSPLPGATNTYATPLRYMLEPAAGVVREAPTRATLKQFDFFWQGVLQGTLRGQLSVDRGTAEISSDSWIANDLDAEVASAWLLYLDPRITGPDGGVPARLPPARPVENAPRGPRNAQHVAPGMNVIILPLGRISQNGRHTQPGREAFERYRVDHGNWFRQPNRTPGDEPLLPNLWLVQNADWNAPFTALSLGTLTADPVELAALMAATRDYYSATAYSRSATEIDMDRPGSFVSGRGVVGADVTHWLRPGEAVLLAYVRSGGPARLTIDGRETHSAGGATLYRVRIPLEYTGRPPRPTPARSDG